MRINISEFLTEFSKNTKAKIKGNPISISNKTLLSLAMVSTLAGCQMTPNDDPYSEFEPQTNYASQTINQLNDKGAIEPIELNYDNYEDIFKNGKSGIFKHPFIEGEVATFIFSYDKEDYRKKLNKQVVDYGFNKHSFEWQYQLLDQMSFVELSNTPARHVQDPTNSYDDINLSIMHYNSVFDEVDVDEFDNPIYEFNGLKAYFIFMHEVMHSMKHQQMSFGDLAKLPFNADRIIELEISADFGALIKTYQFSMENGLEEEFEKMYKEQISGANYLARSESIRLRGDTPNDPHQTLPAYAAFEILKKDNNNYLLNMSNQDIDKMAELVSKEAMNYNFKADFVRNLNYDNFEFKNEVDFVHRVAKLSVESPEVFAGMVENFKNNVENESAYSSKHRNAKKHLELASYINEDNINDLYDNASDSEIVFNIVKEIKIKNDLQGNNELKISNFEINNLFSKLPLPTFASHIETKAKDLGIIKNKVEMQKEKLFNSLMIQSEEILDEKYSNKEVFKNEKSRKNNLRNG